MENIIHTVSELLSILKTYQLQFGHSYRGSDFIFRGMSNKEWSLLPGIFREYSEPQKSSVVMNASIEGRIYAKNEHEIIAHFKKEAGGFLPNIPQTDDFVWMQYAQHFGVPTRLLDFTANPLIALYFCCRSESMADGVIWIINALPFHRWSGSDGFCEMYGPDCTKENMIAAIMKSIKDSSDNDGDCLEKKLPITFIPAYIDQRMSAQSSRFLLWGENESPLEKMIDDSNKMSPLPRGVTFRVVNDQRFLANIIVSGEEKHSIMRELDLLGINEKTVFPGLDGIGRYIERYYKENADDICTSI